MVDRRIQKTKKAITESFMDLIMEKKGPKITITDIASNANIDRKTFYLHYESIDSVFKEIAKDKISEIIIILEENNYFENLMDFKRILNALNTVLLKDIEFYKKIASSSEYHLFWKQLEDLIKETIIEIYLKFTKLPKEELIVFSNFYSAGIISIYISWLNNQYSKNITEIGAIIGEIIFEGFKEKLIVSVQ
ncbi:TetR/AcrR family transcriptional regulator [Fusibacter bizertensis]